MIIDADGHTQIPQEVFDNYMDKEFYRNRPRFVTFDDGRGFYLIEGRLITKPFGWGPGTPGSIAQFDTDALGQRSRSQQRLRPAGRSGSRGYRSAGDLSECPDVDK